MSMKFPSNQLLDEKPIVRWLFSILIRFTSACLLCSIVGCSLGVSPFSTPSVPSTSPTTTRAQLTSTPTPTPLPTRTLTPTVAPFSPDLRVQVISDTALLYQPDGSPLMPSKILRGSRVVLFGRDEQNLWYRVLFIDSSGLDNIGWVQAQTIDYPTSKLMTVLRAPPLCAKGRAVSRGLNSEWISDYAGRIAVVIDLNRSSFGRDFPSSKLQIRLDGSVVAGKDLAVSTRGNFLLRGAVIPVDVRKGQRVGPVLQTTSQEPLREFVTYYSVPDGCTFGQ